MFLIPQVSVNASGSTTRREASQSSPDQGQAVQQVRAPHAELRFRPGRRNSLRRPPIIHHWGAAVLNDDHRPVLQAVYASSWRLLSGGCPGPFRGSTRGASTALVPLDPPSFTRGSGFSSIPILPCPGPQFGFRSRNLQTGRQRSEPKSRLFTRKARLS